MRNDPSRILIADDDPIFLELSSEVLVKAGYETITVQDGVEALVELDSNDIDLAIVDLSMPRIDGLRLIALIRSSAKLRHLPILVITSCTDPSQIEEGYRVGANGCITKPVNWAHLATHVSQLIEAAQQTRSMQNAINTEATHCPPKSGIGTSFFRDKCGSIAVIFSLSIFVILAAVGAAIDFGILLQKRIELQAAADAAVLAGAKRLSFANHKKEDAAAIVKKVVLRYAAQNTEENVKAEHLASTAGDTNALQVGVKLMATIDTYFAGVIGYRTVDIEVQAVAEVVGQPNICLLALDRSEKEAFKVDKESTTKGNDCALFSNSVSSSGISIKNSASVTATNICSSGGVDLDGTASPKPLIDCPQFEDPLASQPSPVVGPCQFKAVSIKNQNMTLRPGVYCGGLIIDKKSIVSLEPGLYIIADGKFEIKGGSTLEGTDVSFYLGDSTTMKFHKDTSIDLEASKAGIMPGILFFASRKQPTKTKHKIESRNAQKLVGTLYFPTSTFEVGSDFSDDANVGSAAAYTAIVANKIKVKNKSSLILNTDYGLTDVPVPTGIEGVGQPVRLLF